MRRLVTLLFAAALAVSAAAGEPASTGKEKPDPKLAARIALGAAAIDPDDGEASGVYIIPVGLYYTAKGTFRSAAAVIYGDPIRVKPSTLDENHEPEREIVQIGRAHV